MLEGLADRLNGLQARMLLPGRLPVLSGVVQLQRAREQAGQDMVVWDHEEQFAEVGVWEGDGGTGGGWLA